MKSKYILHFIALCSVILAQHGRAADLPIYVRGSIGEAWLSSDLGYFENSSTTRYEFGVGWKFADWVSLEAVRIDYETLALPTQFPVYDPNGFETPRIYQFDQKFDLGGYGVSAKFSYSINSFLSVFTRQGVVFTETVYEYAAVINDANGPNHSFGTDNNTAKYRGSVGASFRLPAFESVDLSVELIREDGYDISAESVNLGISYQF